MYLNREGANGAKIHAARLVFIVRTIPQTVNLVNGRGSF